MDYKEWVIQRARELRANPTKSEVTFKDWFQKNYYQIPCCQYPVEVNGKYFILDFFLKSLNIAIEIDGSVHKNQLDKDKNRDKMLFEFADIYTIRIDNRFTNSKTLTERFESKIKYATSVLKKFGKKTGSLTPKPKPIPKKKKNKKVKNKKTNKPAFKRLSQSK